MQSTPKEEQEMSATVVNLDDYRELAHRSSDGIDVTLFWSFKSDDITVEVVDRGMDNVFYLPVGRDRALDAFDHPYAYAAGQGVEYQAPELYAAS
jgi:hypothetical protein